MKKLYLNTAPNFSFKSTVYSHGWSDLKPYHIIEDPLSLDYTICLSSDNLYQLRISEAGKRKLEIRVHKPINEKSKNQIIKSIKRIFRLDEEYDEFYHLARKSPEFTWIK